MACVFCDGVIGQYIIIYTVCIIYVNNDHLSFFL